MATLLEMISHTTFTKPLSLNTCITNNPIGVSVNNQRVYDVSNLGFWQNFPVAIAPNFVKLDLSEALNIMSHQLEYPKVVIYPPNRLRPAKIGDLSQTAPKFT